MSLCIDNRLVCRQTCTPNGHLYRVTYTRFRTDAINSPDDGHMAAQNMQRIEINIHEKELCVKLVIYKDYRFRFGSSLNFLLVMQAIHSSIQFDKHLLQLVHIIYIFYGGKVLPGVTALHVSNVTTMISYGFTVTFTILLHLSRWQSLLISFWSSTNLSKTIMANFITFI